MQACPVCKSILSMQQRLVVCYLPAQRAACCQHIQKLMQQEEYKLREDEIQCPIAILYLKSCLPLMCIGQVVLRKSHIPGI